MKDARYLACEFREMERQARERKLAYSPASPHYTYHEGREMAYRDARMTCEQSLPSLCHHEREDQGH